MWGARREGDHFCLRSGPANKVVGAARGLEGPREKENKNVCLEDNAGGTTESAIASGYPCHGAISTLLLEARQLFVSLLSATALP